MPFQSRAQAGWAFATGQPFARRWARQTGPYKRLPYKKRKKSFTVAQLEAWANSPCYDPRIAQAIADRVAELPRLKGEQIAPGVTRIRGNLCNVHGKYGPCDKALSGKKPKGGKGRKPAKPKATPEQRAQQREQEQAKNRAATLGGLNIAPDGQAALEALRAGQQPDAAAVASAGLEAAGLVERAGDGTLRMSASGRALMDAASSGDAGRAGAVISASRDRAAARGKREQAAADRKLAATTRAAAAAARRAEAAQRRSSGGSGGSRGGGAGSAAEQRAQQRFEQAQQDRQARLDRIAQHEAERAQDRADRQARQREAAVPKPRRNVVSGAGTNRRAKAFRVFKDARGRWRWVAQSSTAYRDRDKEIVSTKALADDCARADASGHYGPLRWWHQPGLDLGECDFNAMVGPVLIESGTFYSDRIAQKVARAAGDLELSLGFFHPAREPDADGVFHHIRRFERSLTPRGRASNLFTTFQVKESKPMDETKRAALKALGFSDSDISDIESRAAATQKEATDQGIAFKAEAPAPEPAALPDVVINGVTYKAVPPAMEGTPAEEAVETPAMEAEQEASGEDPADEGGLTLSPEDLTAIGQAVGAALQAALGPLVGAMDMTNKMGAHMAELKTMMAGYGGAQAKKDADAAATKEQLDAVQRTLAEFTGDAPAVGYRPSAAADNIVTQAGLLQTVVTASKEADGDDMGQFGDIIRGLGLLPAKR